MKKILVLCLTRYGDLIQATPLLRGLKNAHPGARVTLALRSQCAAILPLMAGVDDTVLFDEAGTLALLGDGSEPLAAYREMERFVRLLEADRYDLVVNLTCSPLSAYLASLVRAGAVAGITAAADGKRTICGPWSSYLFSVLQGDNRRLNRINLVDIFARMGGVSPDGRPVELFETGAGSSFAERFLGTEGAAGHRLVGIQLGASRAARCWPAERFARLSDELQGRHGVRTVLLGSRDERELADRAVAAMEHAPLDAVGRTGIDGLFSLLKRCSLLVTNDTGTMHFAAAGGVPVVMLGIGPAAFHSTGPYSGGNLALQPQLPCSPCNYGAVCTDPVCRTAISVNHAYHACRLLLGEEADLPAFAGVQLHRSRFGADGYLSWERRGAEAPAHEELALRYERLWKSCLDGGSLAPAPRWEPLFPELAELAAIGIRIADEIAAAAGEQPLPLERIGALGDREAAVEQQIRLLGRRTPALAPLVDYLDLVRENLTADGLVSIARQTRALYAHCRTLASTL